LDWVIFCRLSKILKRLLHAESTSSQLQNE
jgi:hypothetical protein